MPDDRVHGDARNMLASQRMTIETRVEGDQGNWETYVKYNCQNEIHQRLEGAYNA